MTPKQEYDFGINKDYLYDQYQYDNGRLYKTGYLYHGNRHVGWLDKESGYYRIQIGSETFMLHRLIWIYHNGEIPVGYTVDHKDHDTKNNKIENLRLATRSQQNQYQRKRSGKTSKYIGVWWKSRINKFEVYVSVLSEDGKMKQKYVGTFIDEESAATARDKFITDNSLCDWNVMNF